MALKLNHLAVYAEDGYIFLQNCLVQLFSWNCQCLCLQGEGGEEWDRTTRPSVRRHHPDGKLLVVYTIVDEHKQQLKSGDSQKNLQICVK